MGNIVKKIIKPIFTRAVNIVKKIYSKVDKTLDFVSEKVCSEKPTHNLVTNNLNIPDTNASLSEKILDTVKNTLGLITVPLQMLNDKKFSVHIYESSSTFVTPNTEKTQNNYVPLCEKMLMYFSQNRNKIAEPINKQVLKSVNMNDVDYDIPVNTWYTFNIDTLHKIFFFTHVSAIQNYKSVLVAVNKKIESKRSLLPKIKQLALNYYDQTLGANNAVFCANKQMNFL